MDIMHLLIAIEGSDPNIPEVRFLHKADKILLLYLSPRVKALQYKEKLHSVIKREIEIQIINPKKIVDFYYSRESLLDFIASLPGKLKIGNSMLSEYLDIQGLNMWWTSGIVEATPYKRNIFQNFYYLSAVQYTLEKFNIDVAWFQVEDASFGKDLALMFDRKKVKYCQKRKVDQYTGIISRLKRWGVLKWSFQFVMVLMYWILFKIICPKLIKPQKPGNLYKNMHVFYSYYPYNWIFKDGMSEHKIYVDLPGELTKHLGGAVYYISDVKLKSVFHPCRLIREMRGFWRNNIRFVPMAVYVSLWEILKIFLSPVRNKKYVRLKAVSQYRKSFEINSIDMFHTFDETMRDSILGNDAWQNLFRYYAFRRFSLRYGNNIFQIIYYVEFHNWEVALISGVKDGDESIPVVGLQQSAPNPILLSFFFSPTTFNEKSDKYPLPDLILCSADIYKELMYANGIEPKQVEVVGFIGGHYLKQVAISGELKLMEQQKLGICPNKQFCLVVCTIDLSLTEGIIYLLKETVSRLPKVFFAIKRHPDTVIEPLVCKYGLNTVENVKLVDQSISALMPLADYVLSVSTSVSIEALCAGIPQANLDVGGLPLANPLHMVPGLIEDVETPAELLEFFGNTEKCHISKETSCLFMSDTRTDPLRKILNILTARFHKN